MLPFLSLCPSVCLLHNYLENESADFDEILLNTGNCRIRFVDSGEKWKREGGSNG